MWIELNTAAQKGVVLILEGKDGGVVRLDGDNLVLDTSVALQAIQQKLVDSGITAAANITIPDSDRQIVLANTPGLAQIQTIYGLTSPILQWLPLIIALMLGGAILLARRRARTTVAAGIVLLVSGVVILFGLAAGQEAFTNQLVRHPVGPGRGRLLGDPPGLPDRRHAGHPHPRHRRDPRGLVRRAHPARPHGSRGHVTRGLAQLSGRMSDGRPGPLPAGHAGLRPLAHLRASASRSLLFSDLMSVSTVLWISALVAGLVTLAQLLSGPGSRQPPAT